MAEKDNKEELNNSSTPSENKAKNLTMPKVKKEAKQVNKMEEYELVEDQIKVRFYPVFPESKIDDLLEEMQDILRQVDQLDEDVEFNDVDLNNHIFFLCIKHFTHLGKDISSDYKEQLQQFNHLVDTGYFRQIINEVFLQSELKKVVDRMVDQTSKYEFLKYMEDQTKERVGDMKSKYTEKLDTQEEGK